MSFYHGQILIETETDSYKCSIYYIPMDGDCDTCPSYIFCSVKSIRNPEEMEMSQILHLDLSLTTLMLTMSSHLPSCMIPALLHTMSICLYRDLVSLNTSGNQKSNLKHLCISFKTKNQTEIPRLLSVTLYYRF